MEGEGEVPLSPLPLKIRFRGFWIGESEVLHKRNGFLAFHAFDNHFRGLHELRFWSSGF